MNNRTALRDQISLSFGYYKAGQRENSLTAINFPAQHRREQLEARQIKLSEWAVSRNGFPTIGRKKWRGIPHPEISMPSSVLNSNTRKMCSSKMSLASTMRFMGQATLGEGF